MAYDRAVDIVRLAIRLQGTASGLTLDDIQRELEVSRRTAERLRSAVEDLFGPLETVPTGEVKRHCRLRAPTIRRLVSLSADELVSFPPPPRPWSAPACRNARSGFAASTTSCALHWSRKR